VEFRVDLMGDTRQDGGERERSWFEGTLWNDVSKVRLLSPLAASTMSDSPFQRALPVAF